MKSLGMTNEFNQNLVNENHLVWLMNSIKI
jgi:hypothetical protein